MEWYERVDKEITEKTWETRCTIEELCSKRYYKFSLAKYLEESKVRLGL